MSGSAEGVVGERLSLSQETWKRFRSSCLCPAALQTPCGPCGVPLPLPAATAPCAALRGAATASAVGEFGST